MGLPMTTTFESLACFLPWEKVQFKFEQLVARSFGEWVDPNAPHYASQRDFALGRLNEGIGLVRYFEFHDVQTRRPKADVIDILDIGAGNGGVSLGVANDRRFRVTAIDTVANGSLLGLRRSIPVPIHQIVALGEHLPFPAASFDVVLLLETIEHVPGPRLLAHEIMRVLKPGGVCMITTPPRLCYFFRPDPHFGIKGLFLLPDALQRLYVTKFAKRAFGSGTGRQAAYYDVTHIYWRANGIARLFPEPRRTVVFDLPGFQINGTRARAWKRRLLGGFFWDRVLIYKGG